MNKVATVFIPLTNNTDFSTGVYTSYQKIDQFIVTDTLTGNVQITTNSVSANANANIYTSFTFPPDAFLPGHVYNIQIKKVYYESPTDRTAIPLVGLI